MTTTDEDGESIRAELNREIQRADAALSRCQQLDLDPVAVLEQAARDKVHYDNQLPDVRAGRLAASGRLL